jgi:putative addiction module killer protein
VETVPCEVRLYQDRRGRCPFESWLNRLRDVKARAIVRERIARLMLGNFGDSKSLGEGIRELRVAYGPGYRLYYGLEGTTIIVLLCGGAKSSQERDIVAAKAYWDDYRERV